VGTVKVPLAVNVCVRICQIASAFSFARVTDPSMSFAVVIFASAIFAVVTIPSEMPVAVTVTVETPKSEAGAPKSP
jgi:hypothetical protein